MLLVNSITLLAFVNFSSSLEGNFGSSRLKRQILGSGESFKAEGIGLVAGGQGFTRGKWPWMVAIFGRAEEKWQFRCGGTMISNKHVLTAAHCIQEKHSNRPIPKRNLLLIFGAYDISEFEPETINAGVENVEMHLDWQTETVSYDADIALITVNKEVSLSNYVNPILLPSESVKESLLSINEGFVVGWGKDPKTNRTHETIPKEVKVPIQLGLVCSDSHKSFKILTSGRTFCGGSRDGTGPCTGDSGSGFVVEINNQFYLRGIVSASLRNKDGFCDVNNFAIFTDVIKFLHWLKESVKNSERENQNQKVEAKIVEQTCGQASASTGLIYGGFRAYRGQLPFKALLLREKDDDFFYNGVLISSRHILTDASTFDDDKSTSDLYASLGIHKLPERLVEEKHYISQIIVHPEYEPLQEFYSDADISILLLSKEVTFSDLIQPVCLPTPEVKNVDSGFVIGWGTTEDSKSSYVDVPRIVKINSVDPFECTTPFPHLSRFLTTRTFCAIESSKGPCHGDGGGFYVKIGDSWMIKGILFTAPYFDGSCDNSFPSMYSDILQFVRWINIVISK